MTDPASGDAGVPGPQPMPPARAGDPQRPGSRAWVEQRFGPTATFSARIIPSLIDALLVLAAALIPLLLGIGSTVAGMPDTYECGTHSERTCDVPGTGSVVLIGLGLLLFFLSFVLTWAVIAWNRVWRVVTTGQSLGKRVTGLEVIDAETGGHPRLGPAVLRELVGQVLGPISWIWMLVDDDERTLADVVGSTHVIDADNAARASATGA